MSHEDVSPRPAVSLVTIGWRNEGYAVGFADTLAVAWQRAGGPQLEIIVVANGPEGRLAALQVTDALASTPLEVIVLDVERNEGFAGGANAGVARCSGDILVIANLDLVFDDRFLEVLTACHSYPWDLLVPNVREPDGDGGLQGNGAARRRRFHRHAWLVPQPTSPVRVQAGNGSCLVLTREVLTQRQLLVGGLFDREYGSFNEDVDLFWWAERTGLRVMYEPEAIVEHALAGSHGGLHRFVDRVPEVQRQVMANYRVTVWKHASGPVDWVGWALGEVIYLGQASRSRGPKGAWQYLRSWKDSLVCATAIRRRRSRLR